MGANQSEPTQPNYGTPKLRSSKSTHNLQHDQFFCSPYIEHETKPKHPHSSMNRKHPQARRRHNMKRSETAYRLERIEFDDDESNNSDEDGCYQRMCEPSMGVGYRKSVSVQSPVASQSLLLSRVEKTPSNNGSAAGTPQQPHNNSRPHGEDRSATPHHNNNNNNNNNNKTGHSLPPMSFSTGSTDTSGSRHLLISPSGLADPRSPMFLMNDIKENEGRRNTSGPSLDSIARSLNLTAYLPDSQTEIDVRGGGNNNDECEEIEDGPQVARAACVQALVSHGLMSDSPFGRKWAVAGASKHDGPSSASPVNFLSFSSHILSSYGKMLDVTAELNTNNFSLMVTRFGLVHYYPFTHIKVPPPPTTADNDPTVERVEKLFNYLQRVRGKWDSPPPSPQRCTLLELTNTQTPVCLMFKDVNTRLTFVVALRSLCEWLIKRDSHYRAAVTSLESGHVPQYAEFSPHCGTVWKPSENSPIVFRRYRRRQGTTKAVMAPLQGEGNNDKAGGKGGNHNNNNNNGLKNTSFEEAGRFPHQRASVRMRTVPVELQLSRWLQDANSVSSSKGEKLSIEERFIRGVDCDGALVGRGVLLGTRRLVLRSDLKRGMLILSPDADSTSTPFGVGPSAQVNRRKPIGGADPLNAKNLTPSNSVVIPVGTITSLSYHICTIHDIYQSSAEESRAGLERVRNITASILPRVPFRWGSVVSPPRAGHERKTGGGEARLFTNTEVASLAGYSFLRLGIPYMNEYANHQNNKREEVDGSPRSPGTDYNTVYREKCLPHVICLRNTRTRDELIALILALQKVMGLPPACQDINMEHTT